MEKDIGRIPKSMDTEIVVRVDDFGGRVGLTIREFVRSERYSGFTKAGTRIPADKIKQFKEMIAGINEQEIEALAANAAVSSSSASSPAASAAPAGQRTFNNNRPATAERKPGTKAKAASPAPVESIEEQEF